MWHLIKSDSICLFFSFHLRCGALFSYGFFCLICFFHVNHIASDIGVVLSSTCLTITYHVISIRLLYFIFIPIIHDVIVVFVYGLFDLCTRRALNCLHYKFVSLLFPLALKFFTRFIPNVNNTVIKPHYIFFRFLSCHSNIFFSQLSLRCRIQMTCKNYSKNHNHTNSINKCRFKRHCRTARERGLNL